MQQEEEKAIGVPENAFRELKPGEVYNPLMSPDKKYPEVNLWSVLWGIAMAVLFSAAAAYLGLKVGQVFEAAIPIAIIAVGVSGAAKRKNALGENVIIQSIGASSGVIVAGAIFTLPALYILQESYPQEEIKALSMLICCDMLGLDALDIYMGKDIILSECKQRELENIIFRLQKNEPIQYIRGFAEFCGRNFKVASGVLILSLIHI